MPIEVQLMSLPTPKYALHLPDDVYPPSEDTFLLMDAIEQDQELIAARVRPALVAEVGCGSGVVAAFVLALPRLGAAAPLGLCVDLNENALRATAHTMALNGLRAAELVRADLLTAFRLRHALDLLLFNPPYVPTAERAFDNLSHTYAGGAQGRDALDRLLPLVPRVLSRPHGLFYLVALPQNDLGHLQRVLEPQGLHAEVVLRRRCGCEHLHILRYGWAR